MAKISYPCRKCGINTLHEVESFNHEKPAHNESVIGCTKCDTPSFVVVYDKGQQAPNAMSRRGIEVLCQDEQPTDIF